MKLLLSAAVSAAILAALYWRIDFSALAEILSRVEMLPFAVSMALIVIILVIAAARLLTIVPPATRAAVSFSEAVSLIFAASALNIVLPSKLGDLAKGVFMQRQGHCRGSLALAIVLFEKFADLIGLLAVGLIALLLLGGKTALHWSFVGVIAGALGVGVWLLAHPRPIVMMLGMVRKFGGRRIAAHAETFADAWAEMHGYFWRRGAWVGPVGLSLFLWCLHLAQIWLLAAALGLDIPTLPFAALVPVAILAGLLPLTFAGIGTRDVALVLLLAPYAEAPALAALGVLTVTRYLLPSLLGLPLLPKYLGLVRR